jgi:hypothetical protein
MPVSSCRVKTVIRSSVFEIMELGVWEGGEKMFDRMSLIHTSDDTSKTVHNGEFFMELF